ncbi:SLATT domain-containing protein [[Muricauda] lutisoli]|uniref:SLATT domain-containing protein n=1 Tax=[Muricauda] lutisoli TaxID=2816035 RepID=A0ABS3EV76_9FLAO|nr:SLATT domain-containing protein [[Muricauda] lutisoli]MBO0329846.1 SLATT domain-containing protein [[Muricauda] lutisoli]
MNKKQFKKEIAENAYNVGFGAKKHFASYDILTKLPNWISFTGLAIGIIQVAYAEFSNQKEISVLLIIISIAGLYINFSNKEINTYKKAGEELTQIYNKLRQLYLNVEASENEKFKDEKKELDNLLESYYNTSITKQIFLSQWYAHFKFFYEFQIDWLDKELHFKFWKDKFPNSLKWLVYFIIFITIVFIAINTLPNIYEYFRNL